MGTRETGVPGRKNYKAKMETHNELDDELCMQMNTDKQLIKDLRSKIRNKKTKFMPSPSLL